MMLAFALLWTSFASAALAIDDEFPGFSHFHNWAGSWTEAYHMKLADGSTVPPEISKDMCAVDTKCNCFGGWDSYGRCFRKMDATADYDTYLANDISLVPAAICRVDTGGCNSKSQQQQQWLACASDNFQAHLSLSYQLPPKMIHTTCLDNPKCIGFRVKNDRSAGDLFISDHHPADSLGWFALPSSSFMSV